MGSKSLELRGIIHGSPFHFLDVRSFEINTLGWQD